MKRFDSRPKVLAVSLLLITSGLASTWVLGVTSPGLTPGGVPFKMQTAPDQAGGRYFFDQSIPNGVDPTWIFTATISNEKSAQLPASSGGGGAPQIGPGEDVYYVRESGGNVFMSQLRSTSEVALPTQPLLAQILEVWNDPSRKRSRFRIYVEILELLKERPRTPFEVAFSLRLNVKRTRRYLEFLVDRGVLERVEEDSKVMFRLNPEGIAILDGARRALMLDRYS